MSSQLMRLASFATWPSTATLSSLALARSGFTYTGQGESTVCKECQLVVDTWQRGDRPEVVHRQRSPNCPFVQEQLQDSDRTSISRPLATNAAANVEHSSYSNGNTVRSHDSLTTTDTGTRQVNPAANMHGSAAGPLSSSRYINRDQPDFDRLKDEAVRMLTFYDWPERAARIVEPHDLAKAGMFYTGQTDRVQCAFCRGYLRNWVQGDTPADEHRKHFPDCPFVKQHRDVHDGSRANLTSPAVDVSVRTNASVNVSLHGSAF